MTKIFVAVPAFGRQIISETCASLYHMGCAMTANGIHTSFASYTYPDIADLRNCYATIFHDFLKDYSHMLFVDADMKFPVELPFAMLALNEPVVGVLYRQKKLELEFVGHGLGEETKHGFMKVDGIGFGITLIKREVIATMLEKGVAESASIERDAVKGILGTMGINRVIRAFDRLDVDGSKKSEDLSFCHRWKQCGGEIWANISYQVGHIGLHEYAGKYEDFRGQPDYKIVG